VKFYNIINKFMTENSITGGKADNLTIADIAKMYNVSIDNIQKELNIGINIEMEHTKNKTIALEIALDHLSEFPDYYTRLVKMEKKAKKSLKEMVNGDVVGTSGTESGGITPQDNIPYAKGDARIPKSLFTKEYTNGKKKKRKIQIQRRPKTGM